MFGYSRSQKTWVLETWRTGYFILRLSGAKDLYSQQIPKISSVLQGFTEGTNGIHLFACWFIIWKSHIFVQCILIIYTYHYLIFNPPPTGNYSIYLPLDFMSSLLLMLLLIPWVQLVQPTCAQEQSHPLGHGQPISSQILKGNCVPPPSLCGWQLLQLSTKDVASGAPCLSMVGCYLIFLAWSYESTPDTMKLYSKQPCHIHKKAFQSISLFPTLTVFPSLRVTDFSLLVC